MTSRIDCHCLTHHPPTPSQAHHLGPPHLSHSRPSYLHSHHLEPKFIPNIAPLLLHPYLTSLRFPQPYPNSFLQLATPNIGNKPSPSSPLHLIMKGKKRKHIFCIPSSSTTGIPAKNPSSIGADGMRKKMDKILREMEKLKISHQLGVTDFEDLCYYPRRLL